MTNYVDFEDIALLNEIFLDKNQLLNFLAILEKRIREIKSVLSLLFALWVN